MKTEAEIEEFIRAFEDCTLPRSEWTHGKHIVMALWYIARHPDEDVTPRIREGIKRYNRTQNNLTGYHETITLAWIAVIKRFLAERNADRTRPLAELAGELLEECGSKDYLCRYYSREVLLSEAARAHWVLPDCEPLA